ncbi:uncharacterized protein LOC143008033 isoform X2 [Genypterus blacodes]|uniref:uncharacterized protein LOC143008033 isoform X2 n=1 Tax=Genypterus blacodes TaxID=154954 RepID=UPI003F761A79
MQRINMTSADTDATGSTSSVAMGTDSPGSDPDPDSDVRALCDRVEVLERSAGSAGQSEDYMRNRIGQLERSERSLMLQLCQMASASRLPSMQHSQRLDQRLHTLRDEVRTMTQEKERGERVWRERLQRCQNQLKAKEEEMSRQSLYFESFKMQLQQKLSAARDREQILQNRVYTLEKQLLDMSVAAATNTATIGALRITAGPLSLVPSLRGEGEGEEGGEKREERRKQWHQNMGRQSDEGKTEKETEGAREKDANQSWNEARLQGFILSLKEDLRVLLEREESGMAERRLLSEQLQEAQESGQILGCKVEATKAEVLQLKMSERSLMEEAEELREENHRLQQSLRDALAACPSPGPGPAAGSDVSGSGKAQTHSHSAAVPPVHHQSAVEGRQRTAEEERSKGETLPSRQSNILTLSAHLASNPKPRLPSVTLATEMVEVMEFDAGTWCAGGALNMEESPSEECDALREAYRSLGLGGEESDALRSERDDSEEEVLWDHLGQLKRLSQENAQLKMQVRKQAEERDAEPKQGTTQIASLCTQSSMSPSPTLDAVPALSQDGLVQALNQENRALAQRIEELLAHVELREEEMKREQTRWREQVTRLEAGGAKLDQENQEQSCLITELTRKTEDDLNTIMDLQQRLEDIGQSAEESQGSGTLETFGCQLRTENTVVILSAEDNLEECVESESSQQTGSALSLKTEEEELMASICSLREEHREAALSVQTQTEEKQRLTRAVWGLKEEKDNVAGSLSGLKQEREQLTRTICGLREEREQLVQSLPCLRREKEKVSEALSSEKEEREQTAKSLQSLQKVGEQLRQTVLGLKQQRDELTDAQRDGRRSLHTPEEEEEQNDLRKSAGSPDQSQTQGRNQKLQLPIQNNANAVMKKKTEEAEDRSHAYSGPSLQDLNDLMEEVEALGAELRRSQEELDQVHAETKRLHSELNESEARREEAERKAAQALSQVMMLTDAASETEETRKTNENLKAQVKELQGKLACLAKGKVQGEELHKALAAQLRAKTVALEELNSVYMALKRGKGSQDELSTTLVSLRTRYDDIRAKYDALLKKKSLADLDSAPLKAKLSCLVMKCQERNGLLDHMMKTMRRHGCAEPMLAQRVQQLLSDDALQAYTATFTPGSPLRPHEYSSGFTSGTIGMFQDYTRGFRPDQISFSPGWNWISPDSRVKCREPKDEACGIEAGVEPSLTGGTLKRNANSPVPTSPVPECASAQVAPPPAESALRLSPKASGPIQGTISPETNRGSSPGPASFQRRSPSPAPPPTCVSPPKRLSSPEKIIDLHEQLQKTLFSSYQAPVSRGRGQQPRKSPSSSPSCNRRSPFTTEPGTARTPTTLFTAVASRSAKVPLSQFTHPLLQKDACTPTPSVLSSSSTFGVPTAAQPSEAKRTPSTWMSPTLTRQTPAAPVGSDGAQPTRTSTSTSATLTPAAAVPDVFKRSDPIPESTAWDTTVPNVPTAHESNMFNLMSKLGGAAHGYDGVVSARRSPPRSLKPAASPRAAKPPRPKPEAPAEVGCVQVIKTVGQSSLMIGWERPQLDALGCSNGTFVYGYRVFVDGDFHKSVMSSACTKCILENLDLSVPLHISVQTLGANGLSSNRVHAAYRTSAMTETERRPSSRSDSQPPSPSCNRTHDSRQLLSENLHHH